MGFLLKKKREKKRKELEMVQSLRLRCWGNYCILYCLISIISGKSVFLLCNVFSDIFRICFTQMLDRTLERLYKDIQGNGVQVIAEWQQHPLWCFLSMVRTSPSPLPLSTYPNKKKKRIYRESKWRNKFVLWWFSQRVVLGETV